MSPSVTSSTQMSSSLRCAWLAGWTGIGPVQGGSNGCWQEHTNREDLRRLHAETCNHRCATLVADRTALSTGRGIGPLSSCSHGHCDTNVHTSPQGFSSSTCRSLFSHNFCLSCMQEQGQSDSVLDDLSCMLGCTRTSLHGEQSKHAPQEQHRQARCHHHHIVGAGWHTGLIWLTAWQQI